MENEVVLFESQLVYTYFQRCDLMSIFARLFGTTMRLTNHNISFAAFESYEIPQTYQLVYALYGDKRSPS